tara:strand:- start:242 stop:535 length:294 start_codon:yes stop_codon:yes gene_type:complete
MKTALKFSLMKKMISKKDYQVILKHYKRVNLPSKITKYFSLKDIDKILSFMIKDKKNNSDKINLILLKKIGLPTIDNTYRKNYLKLFLKKELINYNL